MDRSATGHNGEHTGEPGCGEDSADCSESVHDLAKRIQGSFHVAKSLICRMQKVRNTMPKLCVSTPWIVARGNWLILSLDISLLMICLAISLREDGLVEALKRLPLLEELHIFLTEVPCEYIELIGRCCPSVKSVSFGRTVPCSRDPNMGVWDDNEALAIARTMPGLRHLCLFGIKMTNLGLQAILDGCTDLESLDIRKCLGINLGCDLRKRCRQQLKSLRHPNDSTADYHYDEDFNDTDSCDGYPNIYRSCCGKSISWKVFTIRRMSSACRFHQFGKGLLTFLFLF